MAARVPRRGHRSRPHTADVVIEAWGPTAAGCFEEAVAAFVGIFAATVGVEPTAHRVVELGPAEPAALLVLLLDEVLFGIDAEAAVPTTVRVETIGDCLVAEFGTAPASAVRLGGPVPKGVSYSGLTMACTAGSWRCRATVDV